MGMNYDTQNRFMEAQLVGLVEHAGDKGVGAYVIYGQLLAAAAGVGTQLDDELQQQVHDSLRNEFDGDLNEMLDDMEDISDGG